MKKQANSQAGRYAQKITTINQAGQNHFYIFIILIKRRYFKTQIENKYPEEKTGRSFSTNFTLALSDSNGTVHGIISSEGDLWIQHRYFVGFLNISLLLAIT